MAAMHDGPGGNRGLLVTLAAHIFLAPLQGITANTAAFGADKALRPAQLEQIVPAGLLGGEALLKFPKPIVSYLAMLISPFVEYLHYTTNWG